MPSELISEVPLLALAGVLEVADPPFLEDGYEVPLLWHWIYLIDRPRQSELGEDGHRRRSGDDVGELSSRMFASGTAQLVRPLVTGQVATVEHTIESDVLKQGRSGQLRFVTHRYDYSQASELCVVDRRTVVYRKPSPLRPPANAPATDSAATASTSPASPSPTSTSPESTSPATHPELVINPTEALLMRFSALTYNAHRIHYDRAFAQSEGHRDLVVHGPLQAIAMVEAARLAHPGQRARTLNYRMLAPAYAPTPVVARATVDGQVAVVNAWGTVHSEGSVGFGESAVEENLA